MTNFMGNNNNHVNYYSCQSSPKNSNIKNTYTK